MVANEENAVDIECITLIQSNSKQESIDELNGHAPSEDVTLNVNQQINDIPNDPNKGAKIRLEWSGINVDAVMPSPTCFEKMRKCCSKSKEMEYSEETIPILKNVNGIAEPGSLLAIMGASGAGKTTMLNVLSRQNLSGLHLKGSVLVNNKNIKNKMKTISAYVQQEDLFVGTLTVKEHLTFQALLRMGRNYSRKQKKQRVIDVMTQLGLIKCQHTLIGIAGRIRGISGGEMKRLSFASEIITNPNLLFVDEPTSGLDSFMAESSVIALQKLASEGRTILATIHQPSSEVFQLFDRLLLMSNGRTAFLGTTTEAAKFFNEVGHPCPLNFNPADHYIRILAIIPGKEEECKRTSNSICDAFINTKYNQEKATYSYCEDDVGDIYTTQTYKEGYITQYKSLIWRQSKSFQREPYVSSARMIQAVAVAIIAGLIYLKQKNDQDGIRNIHGALFFTTINLSFANSLSVIFVFPAELPVFLRESKQGMYRLSVYFMARTLAELPWYVVATFVYTTITYWMIGFRQDVASFFVFCAVCQLAVQCSVSYGLVISAISSTVQTAVSIAAPLILPFVLFGGFFIKDNSIPVYFIWLKYLSWIKYSFEALEINQWRDFGPIQCPTVNGTCLRNGDAVLKTLGYDKVDMTENIAALFALIVGFRVIAYLFVLLRSYRKK